ncbi:MAG: hypothetical protein LAN63_03930 [Acidobacteriia bacterium]|nr:hypothetical protein [Terriglobia bacterium]
MQGRQESKGSPVAFHESQDIGRSFRSLAAMLAEVSITAEGSLDLVYTYDKADSKKKASGSLLISPLRAGQ